MVSHLNKVFVSKYRNIILANWSECLILFMSSNCFEISFSKYIANFIMKQWPKYIGRVVSILELQAAF